MHRTKKKQRNHVNPASLIKIRFARALKGDERGFHGEHVADKLEQTRTDPISSQETAEYFHASGEAVEWRGLRLEKEGFRGKESVDG